MAERRFNWLLLLPPLVFLGLGAAFILGLGRDNPNELPSQLVGRTPPALPATPLGNRPEPAAAPYAGSEVTLVNFWASWCGPCRIEHPVLTRLAANGMTVIGINYKDDPANAERFLAELGDPYVTVLSDRNGRSGLDWGVYGVPETYLIDRNGKVLLRFPGPVTQQIFDTRFKPLIDAARQN
ncbi:DsbE family thiol:disulfide interchange protein [Halovulum sp. GXIMD14793]